MKDNMYALHDAKAGFFLPPFVEHNDGMAIRQMSGILNNANHPITQHAEDYTLFQIGEFDRDTGAVYGLEPRGIVNLAGLTAKVEVNNAERNASHV